MKNPYAEAIEILDQIRSSPSTEPLYGILKEIAKTTPSVLVKAAGKTQTFVPNYLQNMDRVFQSEGKVAKIKLIKMYREYTRHSLIEAKEFVEKRYSF